MDNEQSVPSLIPVGSDTCTHNVVRGRSALPLIGGNQSFVAGIYHHCKIAICLAKLWKTTHIKC